MTILAVLFFLMAAYSVIANDSIQTLGTWISSNEKVVQWWKMAIFVSTILAATIFYGWWANDGDISYGRLTKIPHQEVEWYHGIAPATLVILTKAGVPVSTSFLVLTTFADGVVFNKMLLKSVVGYALAAVVAYLFWFLMSRWLDENRKITESKKPYWRVAQWISTSFLWWTWLTHDIANVAVFLPRSLSLTEVSVIVAFFVGTIFYIFRLGGGKIQNVVQTKKNTRYVRSATLIDLVYAFLLLYFKQINDIPMSTTWVFIGLLAGRELAIYHKNGDQNKKSIFPILGKDFAKIFLGLVISVAIALFVIFLKGL